MSEGDPTLPSSQVFISQDRIAAAKKLVAPLDKTDEALVAKAQSGDPYIIDLENGPKKLTYFGTYHLFDAKHPFYEEIRKEFEKARPQIVLLEGMPFDEIGSMHRVRELMGALSLEETKEMGEGMYALKLAVDAGLEFDSPEPTREEEIEYLRSQGVDDGFIFLTMACHWIHQYQKEYAQQTVDDFFATMKINFEDLRIAGDWGEAEFDDFMNVIRKDLDLRSPMYGNMVHPVPDPNVEWSVTNETAVQLAHFRDLCAVEHIAETLNTHDRVFIVFGSGHAATLEKALRALMSKE